MSILKLKGNASGTGTVTLEAPNTNTDQTLNIPDGAGSFVTANASGDVGIGTSSPTFTSGYGGIHLAKDYAEIHLTNSGSGSTATDGFKIQQNSAHNTYLWNYENAFLAFGTNNSERARIDSSGHLLVGTTNTDPYNFTSGSGIAVRADGLFSCAATNNNAVAINRTGSDGSIAQFRKDGTPVGSIGVVASDQFYFAAADGAGIKIDSDNSMGCGPCNSSGSDLDNSIDLGRSGNRWDDVYATNGTIQTSDRNEKQQIASLTDAEITAAKAISKLFKTFKWKDKVAEKGDAARTHAGVIAQDVQQAMIDAGLDAGNYAFFISTTWWETQTEVPAVDEVVDEDGNVITEAKEAYTRTDTYDTLEQAPAGATERTRLGIRYPELLAFVGAATEQRLASIEARLDALEAV